ncbi:MAG: AAA family ATPase, partial [Micromonosporaceae bacterium]
MAREPEPFVGRRQELELLRDRLAAVREGIGSLVLISGPAGIGKSRLAEELVAGAGELPVGWGGAIDDVGMPPLWPWLRAARRLPRTRRALEAVVEGGALTAHGSAEEAAVAAFAGYTTALDAIEADAAAGPGLLLVLEDLHWADGASVRLLDRLAAEVRRLPVLVLATHRDPYRGPHHQAMATLLARVGAETVPLKPLAPAEAIALLSASVTGADPAAVRAVVERSGGSPLYLRTVARAGAAALRAA